MSLTEQRSFLAYTPQGPGVRIHVIIPAYNCAEWIGRAMHSVAIQDYWNFDVFVIDDASTDPVQPWLIRELCEALDWDFQLNQHNMRAGYNLFHAIKEVEPAAPEDVFFILDGDDFLPHDRVLSRIAKEYEDPDAWFCVDHETEILTARGWLRYDNVVAGDVALTLNAQLGCAEWQPIQDVYVFPPTDVVRLQTRLHSSVTTLNHRWPIRDEGKSVIEWRQTQDLTGHHRLLCAAPVLNGPSEPKWSDALVELVAWYYTEGTIRHGGGVSIGQSHAVNPEKVDRIRSALMILFGQPESYLRSQPGWVEETRDRMTYFGVNKKAAAQLHDLAPAKVPTVEFLSELTQSQLELFISTSIDADGTYNRGFAVFAQKERSRVEALQTACLLAGKAGVINQQADGRYCMVVRKQTHSKPRPTRNHVTRGRSDGPVWCPTTPNGSWCARRNGTIYFTGNTYGMYEPWPHNTGQVQSRPYPDEWMADAPNGRLRVEENLANHPISFRAFLGYELTAEDMSDTRNGWFRAGYDRCMFIPMLELASEGHVRFVDEILYAYNAVNPISDSTANLEDAQAAHRHVARATPRKPLER